jgi:membrane protease YdiL (CAAX protease family)
MSPLSAEFWPEAELLTTSGLLVALGAVPVGLLAWAARPKGEPLLPPWKPWRAPWSGFLVTGAFLVVVLVLPVLIFSTLGEAGFFRTLYGPDFGIGPISNADSDDLKAAKRVANTIGGLWASVFAVPLQLGVIWAALRLSPPARASHLIGRGSTAGKLALAVVAWLALAPLVLALNTGVNGLAAYLGTEPQKHPLTQVAGGSALDCTLLVVEACLGAPLREEVLIRGLLLAWCIGRTRMLEPGVGPLTGARPWFVMFAAVALAAVPYSPRREHPFAALIFAVVLVLGLVAVWRFVRTGARRARAVYATAAFFALMHSTWPNPIPLFALGLGLGWLAVRTNGVLVPIIVHALFNAVSTVFLLRGGAT